MFAEAALDEARGGVLAHSLGLPDGRLKKGTVLSEDDIQRLRLAGWSRVVVARLEAGDVAEDTAADRLARALAGGNVRVAEPFTGRCNLMAHEDGICVVAAQRINAINRVHESITVATVGPYQPVASGQMLATVKIIPFAVAARDLDAALALAEGPPALDLRPCAIRRPVLVQTRLPGLKPSVLDKTARVTRERLEQLGTSLVRELRCEHSTSALADALGEALVSDADLVMIVGASAIVDRRDVIPAAIEACAGQVEHFGMPVDPGNLLLLGRCGGSVVLGMPGCARSPSYNGLDQVLCMLAAGSRVEASDLTGLGVGGLLKEMPGRPQPRRAPASAPEARPRVAALVLAAGQSRRMGAVNKLLAPVQGLRMLEQVLAAVQGSQARWTLVVTGHEAARMQAILEGHAVQVVHNPDYASGLSTSLAAGLAALPAAADAVLVCLGDMPQVSAADIDRLLRAFEPERQRSICVPTFNGKRGNPVLWDRRHVQRMCQVRGDVGARHLIGELEDEVVEVPMDSDSVLVDVDSPAELRELEASNARPPRSAPE